MDLTCYLDRPIIGRSDVLRRTTKSMLNSRKTRTSLNAMIAWMVVVSMCAQPFQLATASCSCVDAASKTGLLKTASCCSTSVESSCECSNCDCASSEEPVSTPPAIPTESNETETQTYVTCAFDNWIQTANPQFPVASGYSHSTLAYRTAQQTCVLLSRFTC